MKNLRAATASTKVVDAGLSVSESGSGLRDRGSISISTGAGSVRRLRERIAFVGASVVEELDLHLSQRRCPEAVSPRTGPAGQVESGPPPATETPEIASSTLTAKFKAALDNQAFARYTDPTVASHPLDNAPIVCNSWECKG